ncbi:MAG: TrbC/VirB2 family protein [Deltaproteobacteria bacterium]
MKIKSLRCKKKLFGALVFLAGTLLFSTLAYAAAATDPVDTFIGNLATAIKGWGTKGGVIWVIYGIFNVARGMKEEDPHMKSKGWRHSTAAIIFTAGCSQADNIVSLIRTWST